MRGRGDWVTAPPTEKMGRWGGGVLGLAKGWIPTGNHPTLRVIPGEGPFGLSA